MSKGATTVQSGASTSASIKRFVPFASSTRTQANLSGTAWTKLIATPRAGRDSAWVWNSSATLQMVCKMVAVGGSAPTGSTLTDGDFAMSPRQSVQLDLGDGLDLYGINDSGAATASVAVCNEVMRA